MFHRIHAQVKNPVEDFQSKLGGQKKRIIALAQNAACLSPIEGYVWTVVGTCRMNKRSIFGYLCQAVSAWASGLPIPSLLSVNSA